MVNARVWQGEQTETPLGLTEDLYVTVPTGQYKKMEDQVTSMALISKTKKVTLLAHSYGGLVIKRFLTYMLQKGKINLIDKVEGS